MKYLAAVVVFILHFINIPLSTSVPHSYLHILPEGWQLFTKYSVSVFDNHRKILRDNAQYCESWKFVVETNDVTNWTLVPLKCVDFVKSYMTGVRYYNDSVAVADASLKFAKSVNVSGDGKDAWVFDIDETLLSNLPYYGKHGYGSEKLDVEAFIEWIENGTAPALPASLRFYHDLQKLGFTILLITGREESGRKITEENLIHSGYRNWKKLILRGSFDISKDAYIYKSQKRQELEYEGYRMHGSSGDQWSDLVGTATATRSFKLPNPMYYNT